MTAVCHDVSIEPPLQPLTGESFSQQIERLALAWTSRLLVSGVLGFKLHFLTLEYLTLMPLQTDQTPTTNMRIQSVVSMRKGCMRSSTVTLGHLFFQLLEAWVAPPLWPTSVWPSCCPRSGRPHTARWWVGFAVALDSLCYTYPSCA